mgnify:CR=1 FL=1
MTRHRIAMRALWTALTVLAVLAHVAPAQYTTLGYQWRGKKPRVPFYISTNMIGVVPHDGTFEQGVHAILAAADQWNRIGDSNAELVYMGLTDVDQIADDNINVVMYSDSQCPFGFGCLAYCHNHTSGNELRGFDILLYGRKGTSNAQILWSVKQILFPSDTDVWGGACHEFGHALGLGHSANSVSTMGIGCGTGCIGNRTLALDDRNGLQHLYGASTGAGLVASDATPAPGEWIDLTLNFPGNGGMAYQLVVGVHGDLPGTPVSQFAFSADSLSQRIPINLPVIDPTGSADFIGFTGALDSSGRATAQMRVPGNASANYTVVAIVRNIGPLGAPVFRDCSAPLRIDLGLPVVRVPQDQPTIQSAIDAAPSGEFGRTILVAPGQYFEHLDFKDKRVHVVGEAGPQVTVLDGGGSGTVVRFRNLEVTNTSLRGFTVTGANAIDGGGIAVQGWAAPLLRDLHVVANSVAERGGGLAVHDFGSPAVERSHFESNVARNGGAISVGWQSRLTLNQCRLTANHATADGGGLYTLYYQWPIYATTLSCANTLFAGNTANERGGGARVGRGSSITNCTFVGNDDGGWGAALHLFPAASTHPSVLRNLLIWSNASPAFGSDTADYTLQNSNVQGGVIGQNLSVEPQFINAAADNYAILPSSPCRNAGSTGSLPLDVTDLDGDGNFAESVPFDLAGCPRVIGSAVDIGAFEAVDGPSTYCTAQTNSLGCAATVTFTGFPSFSGAPGAFTVRAAPLLNAKTGLFFYGFAATAAPFQGGWKCVASPTQRTPLQSTGGSVSGSDCTGGFAFDMAARIASGVDPSLRCGATVYGQFWSRDPGASAATNLTGGARFTVAP